MHRAVCSLLLFLPATAPAESPVSFGKDVMAILSRGGCNQGACHGNLNGKGGFKLSLRGEDPDFDHAALTRDVLGRRTDPMHPAESLLLQKALGAVAHEGGRRLAPDSAAYAILSNWIADGTPNSPAAQPALTKLTVTPGEQVVSEPADSVTLRVEATFADDSTRDVTRLAVFEPTAPGVAAVARDGTVRREQ